MGTLRPINPRTASLIVNPQAAAHDYDNLTHKPQINGHELSGDQSGSDLGLQNQLTAGDNVTIENGVISAKGGTDDYNDLDNKPQINGVTLSGNKTSGELRVVGWKTEEIDNCIENGVLYSTSINNQATLVLANNITTDITQYAFCRDGRVMWRTRQWEETAWQPAGEWRAWQPAGAWSEWGDIGGSEIASGVVNQNGTISFYDADGNLLFTTTGTSVIGPQGAPGNDYVLTPQDKTDIADIVLQELPTTQGVLYGSTSN